VRGRTAGQGATDPGVDVLDEPGALFRLDIRIAGEAGTHCAFGMREDRFDDVRGQGALPTQRPPRGPALLTEQPQQHI
jgi:hypothetical protein